MIKKIHKEYKYNILIVSILFGFIACENSLEKPIILEEEKNSLLQNIQKDMVVKVNIEKEKIRVEPEELILEALKQVDIAKKVIDKKVVSNKDNSDEENMTIAEKINAFIDKSKNREYVSESLESLVASIDNFADREENLIATFDMEKISTTWKEIESLVDNSEESKNRREVFRKELEILVITASNEDEESYKKTVSLKKDKTTKRIILDRINQDIETTNNSVEWIHITIKSGDTLSEYAEKYYGDASKYKIIYKANRGTIGSNYLLYPGAIIKIPMLTSIQKDVNNEEMFF